MVLSDHVLIRLLAGLRLPPSDYIVTGSGPLLAYGLKTTVHDLDVVARGEAWTRAADRGRVTLAASGLGLRVELFDGRIEVFDHWLAGFSDVDAMIDSAVRVEGIPFMSLADTLRWKRGLGRAKDLADIALIERRLAVAAH
jgi:hypothetical protein